MPPKRAIPATQARTRPANTPPQPPQAVKPSDAGTGKAVTAQNGKLVQPSRGAIDDDPWDVVRQSNFNPLSSDANAAPAGVNRKKQKRRLKQAENAARLAAEQQLSNGDHGLGGNEQLHSAYRDRYQQESLPGAFVDYEDPESGDNDAYEPVDGDDQFYTDEDGNPYGQPLPHQNGYQDTSAYQDPSAKGKKKKKKSQSDAAFNDAPTFGAGIPPSFSTPSAPLAQQQSRLAPSQAALESARKGSKDKIWNTSTQQERENIKKYWLELGEEERRSLVRVEKDHVLHKMKEQQKHSCSCAVCGRKRTAIEEELEVLYDAYYDELEQFANTNHGASVIDGHTSMPPPQSYSQHSSQGHLMGAPQPSRGRVHEIDDGEDLEDEYDDEEDEDEPYSDEEVENIPREPQSIFGNFGNSLTVKDGILTVAEDMLKNDGKHFIDMMEQLAERRMAREEEAQYASAAYHQGAHAGHNHAPLDDEDYDDEDEEDEDYDSQDDEDYQDDDTVGVISVPLASSRAHMLQDLMTEEQRMEEGRRMFQIFAARMFEQRVLKAYREKVAFERQNNILAGLEEEERLSKQREEKKAREAAKKREKKKQSKQAKDAEKAKKEEEKAEQEAAVRAEAEQKLEEQKRRKEEQRKKKEGEKKAQEEERLRKEAEKAKRLQDERDRQAEIERKQREAKEREKRKREEAKKKEREEKEAKEKENRERKANEERERKAREEQKRKDDSAAKAEKEGKERANQPPSVISSKRPSHMGPVPIPPGLHPPQGPSALQSPHFAIATPVIPKAPTPSRSRQPSQQGSQSHGSSPRSQQAGTETSQSSASEANVSLPQMPPAPTLGRVGQAEIPHHSQPAGPVSGLGAVGRNGHHPYGFPGSGMNGPSHSNAPMMPGMRVGMGNEIPFHQHASMPGHPRNFGPPNGFPGPPGINGIRQMSHGRPGMPDSGMHLPFQTPTVMPSSIQPPPGHPQQPMQSQSHSRQPSASFERPLDTGIQTQPIARPAPIQPPSSIASLDRPKGDQSLDVDLENVTKHLGSSALLDDSDVPLGLSPADSMPSAPGSGRAPFGGFPNSMGGMKHENFPLGGSNTWGSQMPFGPNSLSGAANWGPSHSAGWPSNPSFGPIGGDPNRPRPLTIRLAVIHACKQLALSSPGRSNNGFNNVNQVHQQIGQIMPPSEPVVSLNEMLEICDTEGNGQNGGGSFSIRNDGPRGMSVKFEPGQDRAPPMGGLGGIGPGQIGSPTIGHSTIQPFGHIGKRGGFPS